MHIISNVALISINETLWVQMLSFLLFLFIINRVMFRPLRGIGVERRDYIDQIKADTVNADKSYTDLRKQIRSQEAAVRKAASKASREKEAAGNREAEKIIAEVIEQVGALRKKAEAEVLHQVQTARTELKGEVDVMAIAIMEKVLERRISQ
jgi:F-type H+-transporting ATPase subunit b